MADKSIYTRLKKLFSTGIIVRNVGGKQLKVVDTERLQSNMSNAMRERYARIHAGSGYGAQSATNYSMNMAYQSQRIMLFRDYDVMDMDSIINSALDIYADESTVRNEYGKVLSIECDDLKVKEVLENLYYDVLNIEFNLYMWVRSLCKYGDFYLFMEIHPEHGVYNVMPLSVYDTVRLEGLDPSNPYMVKFETMAASGRKQLLENFEVAHFRLLGDPNFLPYGKSMLEGGRRVFRQLILMEDAMLIHRIMRAPEKRVFKIDIGNIPPAEVDSYMVKLMDRMKKVPFLDPNTGEYNLRYNMQNILEDFWLPIRGNDSGTDIQNLGGLEYNAIDDIQYLLQRLFAALKIPKAFLGYEEAISGKLTLAAEDVRFARTIERIQRIVESELYKIGVVHLYTQGYRDETLVDFKINLTTPSTVYDQEKINLWKEKIQLARDVMETKLLSSDWVFEQIFHMPQEEFEKQRDLVVEDVKRTFRYAQIEQGQNDPQKFGYPQDTPQQPQQENPEQSGGAPPAPVPQGQPQPTAESSYYEDESAPGRPKKGMAYGQDSHPAGRDPLGFAERYHVIGQKQDRKQRRKFPLSTENIAGLDARINKKTTGLLAEKLEEQDSDAGTYLDENIIENLND